MASTSSFQFNRQGNKGRLIPHLKLPGFKQMAIDMMLLENSLNPTNLHPTLRFYSWEGAWLSVGKNQGELPNRWKKLAKRHKIQIVNRPSGGGAVLHSGGLTYALIWPKPPIKRHQSYYQACKWLVQGFQELGISLSFGNHKTQHGEENCFSTSTPADLVDINNQKIIGSSQLWKRGNLLQHGEILLNPQKDLWEEVFQCNPPNSLHKIIKTDELEDFLTKSFCKNWSEFTWETIPLRTSEWADVSIKLKDYQLSEESLEYLTKPDATIDSTT